MVSRVKKARLVKTDATPQLVTPPLQDGNGWVVTLYLPRGGGKTAADVIAKRDTVAAELGVDEIQVIMAGPGRRRGLGELLDMVSIF
jgi:S-DNA-T family DNA segregation ATPase FtsK/SpoIIIE